MLPPITWLTTQEAADHFRVSPRTLQRLRAQGLLKAGLHFRRKFPTTNSPFLYNRERIEQTLSQQCSRRDVRTLETAES